jgi:hypothetical protein
MKKTLLRFLPPILLMVAGAVAQETTAAKPKPEAPPNDPAARAFLRDAEERSASWNGFPGFSAEISVYWEGKVHKGSAVVAQDAKVKVEVGDPDARKWAASVLTSIAATSRRKDFETRYKDVGVVFGKDDHHPQGQLVETHGDPYKAKFRILDGEVRIIERTVGEELVILNILSIERDSEDRKRARSFVVNYFDKKSGNLLRSEAIRDRRIILDGYVLPEAWKEFAGGRGGARTQAIFLTKHILLPEVKAESDEQRQ